MGTILNKKRFFVLFSPCLKTIVAPFLPTRLTSPGSPRMKWAKIKKKKRQNKWRIFCNLDPVENSTQYNDNHIHVSLFAAFWKTVSLNKFCLNCFMENVNAGRLNLLPLKAAYLRIIFWRKHWCKLNWRKLQGAVWKQVERKQRSFFSPKITFTAE